MAIASFKPDTPTNLEINLPEIQPKEYKSIIVDNAVKPYYSLLAYIEGSSWAVNYYSQFVSKDNDLREVDVGQSNVYQKYTKIHNLELRVSSPLSESFDSETGITSITGSALVYPFLMPNVADYFVANAGNGRDGLFRITDVERKSFNRESIFSINYDLVEFLDDNSVKYNDLETKVIRAYFFNKDRLVHGNLPLALESEENAIRELKYVYDNLINFYITSFFSITHGTILIPEQDSYVYDPYIVDYLLKIIDFYKYSKANNIINFNIDNDQNMKDPQFWKAILERNINILKISRKKMGLVNSGYFCIDATLNSIRYLRINKVVYPLNDTHVNNFIPDNKPLLDEVLFEENNAAYINSSANLYSSGELSCKIIKPVMSTPYYVLSENFYNSTTNLTLLESLTKDYFEFKPINPVTLLLISNKHTEWNKLQQFYYIPLLLAFIRVNIAGI